MLFSPGLAYWNQRFALVKSAERIKTLSATVGHITDLSLFQFAQLMATTMEFRPDLIIELGRGQGNSTCAFTEAVNCLGNGGHVLSLCLSDDWERLTLPKLRKVVPASWFLPLEALRKDILSFDYRSAIAGKRKVVLFWDAHGFDIAECVLGAIMPELAEREHLVMMHDLSDLRYCSADALLYGPYGLWKGNNWSGPRLRLGHIDSAVEQAVAAVDFTTRNRLTLDSADHSNRTELADPDKQKEMEDLLGPLFDLQGHWFYFSLNEHPGPYTFPRYAPHSRSAVG